MVVWNRVHAVQSCTTRAWCRGIYSSLRCCNLQKSLVLRSLWALWVAQHSREWVSTLFYTHSRENESVYSEWVNTLLWTHSRMSHSALHTLKREWVRILCSTDTQERMSQYSALNTLENESLCSTCTQERRSQTWKTLFTAFISMSPLALSSTNSLFLTQYVFNEVLYQSYAKPKPCVAQLQYSAKQVVSHS